MAPKKVLLVNGEPTMRELVAACLSYRGGWQVSSTGSLSEGLQRAVQEQPDAIVLDLSSSNMDRLIFLQHLRTQPATQTVPVIVLTVNAEWLDLKKLQPFQVTGIIDYSSNPITIPEQMANLLSWNEEPIN